MAETSIMYPSNVKQPLVNTQKGNPFPCCIKALGRDNRYEGYNCANRGDPRYYHEWTNAMELTRGGEIQCGRPSNYYCDHRTFYDIAGYRNTCPIAGCSGTYFQPAVLQLEFSKEHLAQYGIIEGTEMHNISLSFNHRCLGVDVSNSSTSTNWGPNFCGFDKYPDLKVLKIYVTDKNGVIKGNIFVHNENPPLKGYSGVSVTLTGITYADISEGCINIEYQRNLSTNPGNIYIRDLHVSMNYTNAYPYMQGYNDVVDVYMSNIDKCATRFIHTIDIGYRNKQGNIPLSKAPKDLRNGIMINLPEGVTYDKEFVEDHFVRFIFKDTSGIEGVKNIVYTHRDLPNEMIIFGYEAKKYPQPIIYVLRNYIKNSKYTNNSLIIKPNLNKICIDKIDFFINGLDTDPFVTLTVKDNELIQDGSALDVVTQKGKEKFHNAITSLKCGTYEIFIRMNDSQDYTWGHYAFRISPAQYQFEVIAKTQEEVDGNAQTDLDYFHYVQNKQNDKRVLSIKRVDNFDERVTPRIKVTTDTNYQNKELNSMNTINKGLQTAIAEFEKGQSRDFDISVKYPGRYFFNIEDRTNADTCRMYKEKRYIDIDPNHKQNHDVLFVRGEDSTSFEYDYLVAWEGDNIDEPIYISDIDIGQSFNDILLCVEKQEFFTGLSQIGVAKLRVTNRTQKTLSNIRIELNVLNNGEVTLDEFFDSDGIFKHLEENFTTYNKEYIENLELRNLPDSIDDDSIGEENVEIVIKTLEYDEVEQEGDSIEIAIPYMSRSDKTITLQPLIFEEPCTLYTYDDCESKDHPFSTFKLTVYDSILTNLLIEGENDLLEINPNIACPNECFTTDLTYKIQNIDSSSIPNIHAKTKITNDVNLIPYQFKYTQKKNGKKVETIQSSENVLNQTLEDDMKVEWHHDEKIQTKALSRTVIAGIVNFPNHSEVSYLQRTNMKGDATFFIEIPNTVSGSYTLKSLLKNFIKFKFAGNIEHYQSELYINKKNEVVNTIAPKDKRNQVFLNYRKTYKKYKPGDTVRIVVSATYHQKSLDNTIIFYPEIQQIGSVDELTVSYRICNIESVGVDKYNHREVKYNQGLLTTTFETDDYQLIENKVSKDIYVGLETQLSSAVAIDKTLIEQEDLNVIRVELSNKLRDNHDIKCLIDLGPYKPTLLGQYEVVDISVDDGTTDIIPSYNKEVDEHRTSILWTVGAMEADTVTNAQIILKGVDVGLSEITTTIYDYQHSEKEKDYHFGEKRCKC